MEIEENFSLNKSLKGVHLFLQTDRTGLLKYRSCGPGSAGTMMTTISPTRKRPLIQGRI